MRRIFWILIAVVVIALGLSFAMLNPTVVSLNVYAATLELPLAVWIVLAIALGVVLGALSTVGVLVRQRRELTRTRRRADEAHKELAELRKLPIRHKS